MNKDSKTILDVSARYLLIFLLGLGNLAVFYWVFTNPTVFFSRLILSFFGEAISIDEFIIFKDTLFEVARACVAGSAYYLLFILSMAIPLNLIKRLKLIVYCFGIFFIVNVARIVFMALIVGHTYFNEIHIFTWNVFSTLFVVFIWFSAVKIFKVKSIPIYSDILSIIPSKKSKTHKKNKRSINKKA